MDLENNPIVPIHVNSAVTWRGGEMQTFYLASQLHEEGRAQVVVCPKGSPLHLKCEKKGIPVFNLPLKGEWDLYSAFGLAGLAEDLSSKSFKVIIHAHTARAHGIAIAAKKLFIKVPLVVSRRVDFPISGNFLSRWKYSSPLVNMFIAISHNVRNIMIKDGISDDRIRTAYSGVDTSFRSDPPGAESLRKEFGIKKETLVFGNIGALVGHKDQKTFVEAISKFIKKDNINQDDCRFFIVGDGPLEHSLKKQMSALGISADQLYFTGFRNDVSAFNTLFDVFVMTSSEEGLGTSVLDAMAFGKPVIATMGGGIPEMVDDGEGGYLCRVGDTEKLSECMSVLFKSEKLRTSMGKYNRVRVQDFSYKNTAINTWSIYEEVFASMNAESSKV